MNRASDYGTKKSSVVGGFGEEEKQAGEPIFLVRTCVCV